MALKSIPSSTKLKDLAANHRPPLSGWPQLVLIVAGVYNIIFGLWAVVFPSQIFKLIELPANNSILLRYIGLVAALYGVAYLIASTDIFRYKPIITIGLVIKTLASIGYFLFYFIGETTCGMFWVLLFSHLLWLIPLSIIEFKIINQNWRITQNISGFFPQAFWLYLLQRKS